METTLETRAEAERSERSHPRPCVPVVAAAMLFAVFCALSHSPEANALKGFYLGGAVGGEYAYVDYGKSVGLSLPGTAAPLLTSAMDDSAGGISSFRAYAGHRWNLPSNLYVAGEIDATFRLNNSVNGFIEEAVNSRNPDANVFEGNWYLDKNRSVGVAAKLGYSLGAVLAEDTVSVYALAGLQRLDLTLETEADEGELSDGTTVNNSRYKTGRSATPWVAGCGVEVGTSKKQFDLRLTYSRYSVDYGEGDGTDIRNPRIDYDFEVSDWGLYLGYSWSLGFGAGM